MTGRMALSLVLAVILLPLPSLAEQSDQAARAKLEQVKNRIHSLQDLLLSTKGKREEHSQALQQTEMQIGAFARRIWATEQSLKRQKRRLADLESERADARLSLDQHRSSLERQIRAGYAMGRQGKLKILLNQEDPAVVSRFMVYYDYFNSARVDQINEIKASLKQLKIIERDIAQEEQRLQQLLAKNHKQKQQLEAAQLGRKEIIASLNSRLKNKGQELDTLKSDEKQLRSLLSDIQRALSDILLDPAAPHVSFNSRKGKLPWPLRGRLMVRFGSNRDVGKLKWDGVLIAAPEGWAVRAIHHGRVAFADWLRGFGLLLIIDHGDGYMSLYGHNQSLFKETGEWVEPGEVVAQVGNSGGRATSGIYFGIRHNGQPKNPAQWCQRIKGRIIAHWRHQISEKELSFYPVTHRSLGNT
ncbi:MAG: peptidoglycan DD-metalloendopeptidase family protein [Candidatus Thiodiazotropha sp. (ex Lucinoma aequizonata)]|nr:peptidoglycan DD-metalloendopeptidase family protein [Candidatus Thiodiazotropha sp. (ex Lucinoma aequizonata)]MCU7887304.1 peptidoglycan DD-metalloendopeptidase family protein [Candidatus Thiodiazotropha sp. (ex Lucinoma aequizonata)]MCU7898332.1 peptidoglycan DD-metalloendopeptidase family protein [Candidatus Thiodiazotropha sp. (ex Lucinoma aequizonata)]MCU7909963.1 peptidoglycan DD-metalloendopeptidase family protein [Candidatus Thiodiazotropha sp. (ex Lucinoma aequizonata)]MCU7912145.1 